MLRGVIVDVDGTLYDLARVRRRMAWRLLRFAMGQPREGWRTIRALRAFRIAQERMRPRAGSPVTNAAPAQAEVAPSAQADLAAKLSGYPVDFIRRCAARWLDREPLQAVADSRLPGVAEFFSWANEIGLPVAAASDYDPREKVRALGFERQLTAAAWAQEPEVGAFKPDPRVLLAAARRLGVAPAEALYVGDREDVDGVAARTAGMPALVLGAGCSWREVKNRVAAAIAAGNDEIPSPAGARL